MTFNKTPVTNEQLMRLGNLLTHVERDKKVAAEFGLASKLVSFLELEGTGSGLITRILYNINDVAVIDMENVTTLIEKIKVFKQNAFTEEEMSVTTNSLNGLLGLNDVFGEGLLTILENEANTVARTIRGFNPYMFIKN